MPASKPDCARLKSSCTTQIFSLDKLPQQPKGRIHFAILLSPSRQHSKMPVSKQRPATGTYQRRHHLALGVYRLATYSRTDKLRCKPSELRPTRACHTAFS